MEPELRNLLRKVAADTVGESHTHVTLYDPHSRWSVSPQQTTEFWTSYCELVDNKINGDNANLDAMMCLAEKPQEIMPLVSKLTFKFQVDDNHDWEPFDDDFLHELCSIYQSVLLDYFQTTEENVIEAVVVVLESLHHWYETDNNGTRYLVMDVRLQFPYARIEAGIQNRLVRPRVIQLLRNSNIMAKLQRQPVGDWEQIISPHIVNEPLPMFGSNDMRNRPLMQITHIWSYIDREALDSGFTPAEFSIADAFIPYNHQHVQNKTLDAAIFDQDKPLEYWLPLFLSTGYWSTVLMPKANVNDGGRFSNQIRTLNINNNNNVNISDNNGFGAGRADDTDENDAELAERMIPMLNTQRFLREAFWMDIGQALYHSNDGDENGILSWISHTQRAVNGMDKAPPYMLTAGNIPDTCRNLYYTFANSNITVKTLAWYAREDSPDNYANWHKEWCTSSMEEALSGTHTDVAIALHRVYWLDFVYCSIGSGKWFQFKSHRWSESNQGMGLRRAMSREFMKRFEQIRIILSQQIHQSENESFRANGEITLKKIGELIRKLKNVPFKMSLMREASEHFNHDTFVKLLDLNPDLTGVTNGVLEVSNNVVLFRAAKPEDYVSMCTNIPYHHNFTWEHPLVRELMTWFGQVFIDRELLHHFVKFAASCLKGRNSDKIFPIWTGDGNNSKSMIVKLFEATFASYCIKFDTANVTARSGSPSGPTPQLARARGTRIAFMDEPADDVPINKENIKRWIGGDSFFSRFLNDNGGDVAVLFKLVLTCNKVPIIPNADQAIKNRTRLFPFLSNWCLDYPEDITEQYQQKKFKMDPFFERRIPIMAPAFLWVMAQYYPFYSEEKLNDPPIVTETTDAYWRDNDVYAQFANDCIQEIYDDSGNRDNSYRVTLGEVYAEFKTWFRDAFPTTKVPDRCVVRNELTSRWGRLAVNSWYGMRIMSEDEPGNPLSASGPGPVVPPAPSAPSGPIREKPNAPGVVTLAVTKPIEEKPINILDKLNLGMPPIDDSSPIGASLQTLVDI